MITTQIVKFYVYEKKSGVFSHEDAGLPDMLLLDLGDAYDFTLSPPPSMRERWAWNGLQWELISELDIQELLPNLN